MIFNNPSQKTRKLEKRILDLESTVAAKDRQLAVAQAEIDSLAGVIARDRMRVASECAIAARTKADAEGSGERINQSIQ